MKCTRPLRLLACAREQAWKIVSTRRLIGQEVNGGNSIRLSHEEDLNAGLALVCGYTTSLDYLDSECQQEWYTARAAALLSLNDNHIHLFYVPDWL